MEKTARIYHCTRCQKQTIICTPCDRGNIYCSSQCSKKARKNSLAAAGSRYQKTYQGKVKHAARQKRYRSRQKQKVTHQGSLDVAQDLPSTQPPEKGAQAESPNASNGLYCHFCSRYVPNCLRLGRLGNFIPVKRSELGFYSGILNKRRQRE